MLKSAAFLSILFLSMSSFASTFSCESQNFLSVKNPEGQYSVEFSSTAPQVILTSQEGLKTTVGELVVDASDASDKKNFWSEDSRIEFDILDGLSIFGSERAINGEKGLLQEL